MAFNVCLIVKSESSHGHPTGSHVHFKSGSISKTMLDRDTVTTGH